MSLYLVQNPVASIRIDYRNVSSLSLCQPEHERYLYLECSEAEQHVGTTRCVHTSALPRLWGHFGGLGQGRVG